MKAKELAKILLLNPELPVKMWSTDYYSNGVAAGSSLTEEIEISVDDNEIIISCEDT